MSGNGILRRDRVGFSHGGILVYINSSPGYNRASINAYSEPSVEIVGFTIHSLHGIH